MSTPEYHQDLERRRQFNMAVRNYMKLTNCNYKTAYNTLIKMIGEKERFMTEYSVFVEFHPEDTKATDYLAVEFVRFKVVTTRGDEKTVFVEVLQYLSINYSSFAVRSIEVQKNSVI